MTEEKFETQTRSHHPSSPSSLQSTEACPHFTQTSSDSAASLAGVLQHRASETGDLSILEDAEQVAAVKRYLSVVAKWRKTLEDLGAISIEAIKEVYLSVGDDVVIDDTGKAWKGVTGGYPDDILLATFVDGSQLAVIIDAKFGKHLVTPTAHNMQGISYSRATMEKWPRVKEVACQFHHPFIEIDAEGNVSEMPEYTHTFLRSDYDQMELMIRTFVERKKLARATGFNGPIAACPKTSLCIYCDLKATCPANGALMVLGASKHRDIEVPDVFNPCELTKPEDYARAFSFANSFELVAKAIKARCTEAALTEGVVIPGYELTRRTERKLGAPSDVKRVLIEGGFITEQEYDDCANIPITKVEECVKAKAAKGKGAARLREFEAILTDAGLLTRDAGYMYLREVKNSKLVAVEEKPLNIR